MIAARKAIFEHWKRTGHLPSRSQGVSASISNFDEAPPSQALLDEAKIYAEAFQMPPERAIAYLRAKNNEITWSWKDIDAKAHQKAFTVAKVMTADVLQMIRTNLESAQKNGIPFEKFKKNLQPMLEESGWWGKQQVENPNTGKTETVQLGSAWRLETVYRTNLATARAQGRYAQQKEAAALLPFWEYRQIDRDNKRDEHAKMAGKIFRANDTIWQRIYPPRGFNCGCSVQARSQKWMDRNGRVLDDSNTLAAWQPDEGWDFNPEEDWQPDLKKYDNDMGQELQKVLFLSKQTSSTPTSPFTVSPQEQNRIAQFLESIFNKEPQRFQRGFVGLEIRDRKELNAIAGTDGKGTLYFSPEPAQFLASALKKLQEEEPLTFDEEQAFVTLEHEILHNEAKGFRLLSQDTVPSNIMELLNEITARNTYQRHLEAFNRKPQHKKSLRTNGNGYPLLIKNFDLLLARVGVVNLPLQEMQQLLLQEDYANLFSKTVELLLSGGILSASGIAKEKLQRLLANINDEDFAALMDKVLQ